MKDIICECGHDLRAHNHIGCAWDDDCQCEISQVSILLTHVAKQDKVIEAVRKLDREMGSGGIVMANNIRALLEALAALDAHSPTELTPSSAAFQASTHTNEAENGSSRGRG